MKTVKERVDEILKRPMSRQQFLRQVGLVVLAMVGVSSLLNVFESKHSSKGTSDSAGPAYGASVYAGGKKPV